MTRLYQSPLYKKHHWRIVGSILFLLILIGAKFKGNIFLPRVAYFGLAGILFIVQIAMITICEKDAEKRKKEYIEGLRWLAVPIIIILSEIHSDWVYSY